MAIFRAEKFEMKNGTLFQIRSAISLDAPDLLALAAKVSLEDERTILTSREEFRRITLASEEAWVASFIEHMYKILLVAEVKNKIVGILDCTCGSYDRNSHVARLGMAVAKEYRGQGIGKKLLQCVTTWAKSTGHIEKLELQVYTGNARAISMYQKTGFKEEYISPKAVKFGTNDYLDSIHMGLWL